MAKDSYTEEQANEFFTAVSQGDTKHVSEKLKADRTLASATINFSSNTPLHVAVENGHEEVVDILLAAKPNIDAQNAVDKTPLHVAAKEGYERIVNSLLAAGANVNVKSFLQDTPSDIAAIYGHDRIAQALRPERGIKPAAKGSHAQQHEERKAETSPDRGFGGR